MSEDEANRSIPVETTHDSFVRRQDGESLASQIFVVQRQLEELLRGQPDKGAVQTTRDMTFQVMSAMANIASKEGLREVSQRIATLEVSIGKVGQTSVLNERDVAQLKDGQSSIRIAVRDDSARVEKSLEERKRELEKQIEELRNELDKQTAGITKEFDKQTEGLTKELEKQVTSLSSEMKEARDATQKLAVDLSNSRAENSRYLLGTLIAIVLLIIAVATFVVRGASERPSAPSTSNAAPVTGVTKPASAP